MPLGAAPYLYERVPGWSSGPNGCEMGVLSGVGVSSDVLFVLPLRGGA